MTQIKAELLDSMGDDLAVVDAARVSFNKKSEWAKFNCMDCENAVQFACEEGCACVADGAEMQKTLKGPDKKLIEYLAKYDHWCYDDKTEIFTERGWVNFSEVSVEDKVAAVFGWEENEFNFSFVNPEQVHRTYYEGHMYEYDSNVLSYSVTPHHKMLFQKRDRKGLTGVWEIGNSNEVFGKEKLFQTTAKMKGVGSDTYLTNMGKLYGFLLGDGFYPRNYETRKTVYCRLKKVRKIKYLEDLLTEMGISYKLNTCSNDVMMFSIKFDCELYNKDGDKYFPIEEAIKRGPSFCAGAFDGLLNSDGSVKRNTYTFSSSSRPLFELFMAVGTVAGYNVLENKKQDTDRVNETYRAMVQTRETVFVNKSSAKYKEEINYDYKGYVSCVTVPTGMLLVRRDGKQMVCGNTPFAHTALKFRCSAPVPIRTQAFKHKIGMVENEESRRYISSTPEIFIPEFFRAKPEGSIKQGSAGVHPMSDYFVTSYRDLTEACVNEYLAMIGNGICPEQARFILPQGAIVNWIWTGNLVSFANFYNKRTEATAQYEVKILAESVGEKVAELFPVSWKALTGGD